MTNTLRFDGGLYNEAPERNKCEGCAFKEESAEFCASVQATASKQLGGDCIDKSVIYVAAGTKHSEKPYGWAVTGGTTLYTGEGAEYEARVHAMCVGGDAKAFPLYRGKEEE